MALAPRPQWEPLPEPEPPDPATATEFQTLAGEVLEGFEAGLDQVGLDLVDVDQARVEGTAAAETLGLDLAAGASELGDMQLEAEADTLIPELTAAAAQDAALASAGSDVGTLAGETATTATPVVNPQTQPVNSNLPTVWTGVR
jgi:hypothetical protein